MVLTMNKESMQTKWWLIDRVGGKGVPQRKAVTSVFNNCERSVMFWHWFIDEKQREECILFREKIDMSSNS